MKQPRPKLSIEQVKQKYEMEWMKIPGVEGVGITQTLRGKAIVIYCSTEKIALQNKIPTKIQGYKIVFKYTGEINAF